jgi:hypothetical protein
LVFDASNRSLKHQRRAGDETGVPQPRDPGAIAQAKERLDEFVFHGLDGIRLVFVNGVFAKDLSASRLPRAAVENLAAAMRSHRDSVEKYLGKLASFEDHAFVALNTAFNPMARSFMFPRDGPRAGQPVVSHDRGRGTDRHSPAQSPGPREAPGRPSSNTSDFRTTST